VAAPQFGIVRCFILLKQKFAIGVFFPEFKLHGNLHSDLKQVDILAFRRSQRYAAVAFIGEACYTLCFSFSIFSALVSRKIVITG